MLPPSHFEISLIVALVATLIALAGIEYAILRRLISRNHPSGPKILTLIVAALFLAIFIAPFLLFLFGAICAGFWYLTYDPIFLPLYHRTYIRSFEAHLRQKPLQVKLKRWQGSLGTWPLFSRSRLRWSSLGSNVFKRQRKRGLELELQLETSRTSGVGDVV